MLDDITGATGMRIIRAVLAGERDPVRLAAFRHGKCTHSEETIAKALEGTWRAEQLFALTQAVELIDLYEAKISACDARIEACLARFADREPADGSADGSADESCAGTPPRAASKPGPKSGVKPGPKPRPKPRADRHDPRFDAAGELQRITGVDLTAVDGIQAHTALKLISEIGLDMTRWPSAKHFGSWLGLAPNNRVSGGKILGRRTTPTANRAATALRIAAQALHHARCALGAFLRRKAAHLGMPKAITATAYKLARIIYTMLRTGRPYSDLGQDEYERRYQDRVVRGLRRRANAMGFILVKQTDAAAPAPAG